MGPALLLIHHLYKIRKQETWTFGKTKLGEKVDLIGHPLLVIIWIVILKFHQQKLTEIDLVLSMHVCMCEENLFSFKSRCVFTFSFDMPKFNNNEFRKKLSTSIIRFVSWSGYWVKDNSWDCCCFFILCFLKFDLQI